ncbi:hypothetical protein LO749_20810 [Paracoccus denitrificans]|uniref:phage tail fiber domain-containing protein n=1 Tax=Paracoccus denitrificans TaxID=266 RepID=UPI001E566B42|nr:phage tail fiber protein [Paracoccus denitrificans]UFS66936.1 hypothetical protein LO749_20810 [Paracoccus denitrificans]
MTSNVSASYPADGTVRNFDIPFPYLLPAHIKAHIDSVPVDYSWVNPTRIRIDPAPPAGSTVKIFRVTPQSPLYTIPDNRPVPSEWYNRATRQAIYVAQELQGDAEGLIEHMTGLKNAAEIAANEATGAAEDIDGKATRAENAAAAAEGFANAMGDAINAPYTLPEDRLSLPATNGAPLDDDLTPGTQTFTDEVKENYAAPPPGVVNAAARATGLIVFDPPSQESTNYVYTDVPWFTHRGTTFRALPVDISATVFNSLVGPCLFEPVATNSWGMLVWRYIGDKPIHSFLQGQMAMRVRTSGTANDAFHKLVLNLRTWDAPHMEAGGQSNGRRFLSTFIGSYQQPVKMTDYEGMNDECLPLTQAVWTAHSAEADRFVGYDNGYFDESSGEVLLTTEGGSPVGAEVRTTKWIDVSDIDASERCLAVWVAGKSRRSRMQWKDSNGDVHFYPVMSRDQHCRRVFRLPHGAQEVRFHYSGPGDDVSSIAVKRMGPENSAEHDPLKGFWYDAQFAFGRDVTLWPGAEYAFDLLTLVYNDASGREWAFRDYGSGFSMPFDATDFLRETASRYFGS